MLCTGIISALPPTFRMPAHLIFKPRHSVRENRGILSLPGWCVGGAGEIQMRNSLAIEKKSIAVCACVCP